MTKIIKGIQAISIIKIRELFYLQSIRIEGEFYANYSKKIGKTIV